MSVSYGGIPLVVSSHEHPLLNADAWMNSVISPKETNEFGSRLQAGVGEDHWPGSEDQPLPDRVGELIWPSGAARFACGHFLATTAELNQIRPLVHGGTVNSLGVQYNSLSLVLDDGVAGYATVNTQMFMLPPRPLSQIANVPYGGSPTTTNPTFPSGYQDLWLITLVDERYFWRNRAGQVTQNDSWVSLYGNVAALLGTAITGDAIDPAYGNPPAEFANRVNPSLAYLLDAIAYSVGQRIVRRLDGSLRAESFATSSAVVSAILAAASSNGWDELAGGQYYLRQAASGSLDDRTGFVPGCVAISFRRFIGGVLDDLATVEARASLVALAPPGWSGALGNAGTKTLSVTASYETRGQALPFDRSFAQTFTNRWAYDWYSWQLADLDIRYSGLVPWTPTALEDHVRWTHTSKLVATRIVRRTLDDVNDRLLAKTPISSTTTTTSAYCTGFCRWAWVCGPTSTTSTTSTSTSTTTSTTPPYGCLPPYTPPTTTTTSTTSTSTTSTTTTPPCNCRWVLQSDGCSGSGCHCLQPDFCPCNASVCAETTTYCVRSKVRPQPYCCSTTTTTTPSGTTTTSSGTSTTPSGLGCSFTCGPDGWISTGPACYDGSYCIPPDPSLCSSSNFCEIAGLAPCAPVPGLPAPVCVGSCLYVWISEAVGWVLSPGSTCKQKCTSNGVIVDCLGSEILCDCYCSPPTILGGMCGETAGGFCSSNVVGDMCSPVPTTPPSCAGSCCWTWDSVNQRWRFISRSCLASCACNEPFYNAINSCEEASTPCFIPRPTTTSTTSTTSTTPSCNGYCIYRGIFGGQVGCNEIEYACMGTCTGGVVCDCDPAIFYNPGAAIPCNCLGSGIHCNDGCASLPCNCLYGNCSTTPSGTTTTPAGTTTTPMGGTCMGTCMWTGATLTSSSCTGGCVSGQSCQCACTGHTGENTNCGCTCQNTPATTPTGTTAVE